MDRQPAVIAEREGRDGHAIFSPKADVADRGAAAVKSWDNLKEARSPFSEAASAKGVDRSPPKP